MRLMAVARRPGARGRTPLIAGAPDVVERFAHERVLVGGGDLPANQLRGDGDREVDGFGADLLDRLGGLALNLPLGFLRMLAASATARSRSS